MGQQNILKGLSKKDWWSRQQEIAEMIKSPADEFYGCLEESIRNHEDADIRNTAIEVYSALGVRSLGSLSRLLEDHDPEVRLFAVNILCEMGDKDTVPFLISSIKDPDINVRVATAEALGSTGNEAALDILEQALGDEPWVVMAAINAMGEIGGDKALAMLYKCCNEKAYEEISIAALEKAGNRQSIQHLTELFERSDHKETVLKAVVKIAERERVRPRPEYFIHLVPVLLSMLESPNQEMKRYAFIALCWSRDILALPYMLEAVMDDELQEYAIEGLLCLGRMAVCSIIDELKDSRGSHRVVLAKVLSMIGEKKALLQFAEDEDPEVRTEVALAIARLDMSRASQILEKMQSDPSEEVQLAARKSLDILKNEGHQS